MTTKKQPHPKPTQAGLLSDKGIEKPDDSNRILFALMDDTLNHQIELRVTKGATTLVNSILKDLSANIVRALNWLSSIRIWSRYLLTYLTADLNQRSPTRR